MLCSPYCSVRLCYILIMETAEDEKTSSLLRLHTTMHLSYSVNLVQYIQGWKSIMKK